MPMPTVPDAPATRTLADPTPAQQPYRCPVCIGRGIVPTGFYLSTNDTWSAASNIPPDECRSCSGTGIVWR